MVGVRLALAALLVLAAGLSLSAGRMQFSGKKTATHMIWHFRFHIHLNRSSDIQY